MTEFEDHPFEVACKLARFHYQREREAAAARAEKVLAAFYGGRRQSKPSAVSELKPKVAACFNGHPIATCDVIKQFPKEGSKTVRNALAQLVKDNVLESPDYGFYQRKLGRRTEP